MLVNTKHITSNFTPLVGSDLVGEVKERMQQEQVHTLPVVDSTTHTLIGQMSYSALKSAGADDYVADISLQDPVKIYRGQHIFEAARLLLQYEQAVLPVVDEEMTMLGVLTRDQVLASFPHLLNVTEAGSVLTIALGRIDFSISEIVQIIESEGAKILGMTVEKPEQSEQTFELSFKLDLQDISRVASALRRYDYTISTNTENEIFNQDLETRADELIKYIDM